MERRITEGKKPPFIMKTNEFGQAIEVYRRVLETCKVSPESIQKQLVGLQDPTAPRKRIMGFINLTKELKVPFR